MYIVYVKPNSQEKDVVTEALHPHTVFFLDDLNSVHDDVAREIEVLSVFVDTQVDEATLNRFPKLKFIATRSVGFDHIAVAAARERGILISRVPHYGSQTVAEFAFALMFALSRNAFQAYIDLMADTSVDTLEPYEGFDLGGKTLGVVGTGKIGQRVCAIAKSFGMNVIAYDQFPNDELIALGTRYATIESVMKESDMVTLHVPSLPSTHHLIDMRLLSLMKPTAYLINTARGEVVDTQALVDVLTNKQIAGAGLDVLEGERFLAEEETLTEEQKQNSEMMHILSLNHMLIDMPNVVVTPHIAFNTKEAKSEITQTTLSNILGYINNEVINQIPS